MFFFDNQYKNYRIFPHSGLSKIIKLSFTKIFVVYSQILSLTHQLFVNSKLHLQQLIKKFVERKQF